MIPNPVCPKPECGGTTRAIQAAKFPVVLQIVFGLSFLFYVLQPTGPNAPPPQLLWAWTGAQCLLGFALIRARRRAQHRVFVCTRCGTPLRSSKSF